MKVVIVEFEAIREKNMPNQKFGKQYYLCDDEKSEELTPLSTA